jgi:RNA polymerase sigma-70 factor (ECF subfamily)
MRYKSSVKTFRTFYMKNKDKLFAYLMRRTGDYQLSSDTMQESFTRLLSRYGPHEQSVALLFKIARNIVTDEARKSQRNRHTEDNQKDENHDSEKMILVRETYKRVLAAMQKLEKTERDILSLVVSSELSYKDIADITGISEGNVRVKIHRARMNLKKNLQIGDNDR